MSGSPMSSWWSLPLATAAALVALQGCATQRFVTKAPSPPEAPEQMQPFRFDLPVPEPAGSNAEELKEDRFVVHAVPGPLPFASNARVVIAIPQDATPAAKGERGQPVQSQQEKELRASLMAGFLASGYRVKDAGVLNVASLNVRRHPDHASKKTTTTTSDDGQTVVQTEARRDQDWWWNSEGLRLMLNDPTSLWVSDLLSYPDLEADAFFRIFSLETWQGTGQAELRYHYTDEQIADFKERIADANKLADFWNEKRIAYSKRMEQYDDAYSRYVDEHERWQRSNMLAYADRHQSPPSAAARSSVQVPDPPPIYTEEALRRTAEGAARRVDMERLYVRIVAEAVDARNGQVIWVGDVTGATTVDRTAAKSVAMFRVMEGLVREMTTSKRR